MQDDSHFPELSIDLCGETTSNRIHGNLMQAYAGNLVVRDPQGQLAGLANSRQSSNSLQIG